MTLEKTHTHTHTHTEISFCSNPTTTFAPEGIVILNSMVGEGAPVEQSTAPMLPSYVRIITRYYKDPQPTTSINVPAISKSQELRRVIRVPMPGCREIEMKRSRAKTRQQKDRNIFKQWLELLGRSYIRWAFNFVPKASARFTWGVISSHFKLYVFSYWIQKTT